MAVDRSLKGYDYTVYQINFHHTKCARLTDEALRNKTDEFKKRLSIGEALEDLLPEAYAVVKEAVRRFHPEHLIYHDVQLMGGIALNHGDIAELQTGEGKTITAILPAYLNALTGEGVHIITTNDYLAERDYETLKPVYESLGLSVGLIKDEKASTKEEDIRLRKEAYSRDVTYASSSAIVFDYEKDNTALRKEDVVRRRKNPGFAIVDEADKIFLDDAMIPYILSKSVSKKKTEFEIIEEQKKKEFIKSANDFVYRIYKLDRETRKKRPDGLGVVRLFETKESEDIELYGDNVRAMVDKTFLATGSIESSSMSLTSRGWFEAFKYFKHEEISLLTSGSRDVITRDFTLGEEYIVSKYGIELTDKGLDKAINQIPEFKKINNDWYLSEDTNMLRMHLDNALKAYFITEYGKDYGFVNDGNKRKVCSIVNGRMAEGRVYSGGLQEAIEAKERTLSRLRGDKTPIVDSDESVVTASITQKSFYALYGKVAGMTGTASKEMFEDLYGFKTTVIPRHYGKSKRVEHPDTLYYTEEEKLAALVNEVVKSHNKGQPVLIATMSVEESKLVHKLLQSRGINAALLNAEASDKEESRIVANAGRKGSVTVTTQMAGRGTDIKLGGDTSDIRNSIVRKHVTNMTLAMARDTEAKTGKKTNPKVYEPGVLEYLRSDEHAIASINKSATEELRRRMQEKEEVETLGGLKLIGCGHFSLERDDRQLVGRTARQNDPGESVFFTSVHDLEELHTPRYIIEDLKTKHGLKEGHPVSGAVVNQIVVTAQKNIEGIQSQIIANNHEKDYVVSTLRESIYRQRKAILEDRVEPIAVLNNMVEGTTSSIIGDNLPNTMIKATTKISKSDLDLEAVKKQVKSIFGIEVSDKIDGKSTLKDLARDISVKAKEKIKKDGITCDKSALLEFTDSYWIEFQQDLDFIKFDGVVQALGQNKEYREKTVIQKTYNENLRKQEMRFVAKVFGGKVIEKLSVSEAALHLDDDRNNYNLYDQGGNLGGKKLG